MLIHDEQELDKLRRFKFCEATLNSDGSIRVQFEHTYVRYAFEGDVYFGYIAPMSLLIRKNRVGYDKFFCDCKDDQALPFHFSENGGCFGNIDDLRISLYRKEEWAQLILLYWRWINTPNFEEERIQRLFVIGILKGRPTWKVKKLFGSPYLKRMNSLRNRISHLFVSKPNWRENDGRYELC